MDEFDVVVLGTGAAGLTAAIRASAQGADVGLFEKLDQIGGTAAWSGGMAWIPGNPQLSGVLTITETPLGRGAPGGIPADELARRQVNDERGTGQALVGRLVKGCLDRGIEPRTGMRATRLLTEGTRVTGVRFESADGPVEVRARRGVVIDTTTFEYANHPAWMIFDDVYWRRYGLANARPDKPVPAWITTADSVAQLAKQIDVPEDALEETVRRWNENTAREEDPDFGRGTSAIDKWWGDPQFGEGPAATLGPLDAAPYYAVRVYSGCLGTKGGPKTDDQARVLDLDGAPIAGLYAAGNAMAVSAMGMSYGGAGGTLGPAIVWGFLAGQHAASHPA